MPSKRGDEGYFAFLHAAMAGFQDFADLRSNSMSGSVLLVDERIDRQALADFARSQGLFNLRDGKRSGVRLSTDIAHVMQGVSSRISRATGGELDLSTAVFLALVINGVAQIARGNFASPPWYTAFWYALGIFSKSSEKNASDDDGIALES